MDIKNQKPVLVTGATGYVAGRLIPLLLADGYRVRTMGRSIPKMTGRPWARDRNVELVNGDIMDVDSLRNASRGCGTIYYLVHSMVSQKNAYRHADRIGAKNMVQAAADEQADHLIYLGGLGDIHHQHISRHLISRNEVGQILLSGPVPATVLRAAMILGSGSASFEILRYLAERLPVMVTPKWVSMPTQPIAITNIIGYLKGCMEHPETRGKTYDIGGKDVVAYRDLFRIFAKQAGLPAPVMIPVPVLTPRLSSLWIHLVTPVPAAIAQPLTEGLSLPTVCTESAITTVISQDIISCSTAIQRALDRIGQEQAATCQTDKGTWYLEWPHFGDSAYSGGTTLSCGFRAGVQGTSQALWSGILKNSSNSGFYAADFLWKIHGIMDRLVGGTGLNRHLHLKDSITAGDTLDFWKVLQAAPPSRLLLLAELKTPGHALLEINIRPVGDDDCEIELIFRFLPKGLIGIACWYVFYPFHRHVLSHMLSHMVNSSGLRLGSKPRKFTPKAVQFWSSPRT